MNSPIKQRNVLLVTLSLIFCLAILLSLMQSKEASQSTSLESEPPPVAPIIEHTIATVDESNKEQVVEVGRLLVNSASADEIAVKLKGIGAKTAQAIVDYREKHGSYQNLQQLLEIRGIGLAKIETNKDVISFEVVDSSK